MPAPKPLTIRYRFDFPDGSRESLSVELDPSTLELRSPLPEEPPRWTALEFEQCPHCPLDIGESPRCPAAMALAPVVDAFDHLMSHDRCSLRVEDGQRAIVDEDLSVQKALGSLLGLVLAAGGCPYTAALRPMARFHLPLASAEETIYRATSMYLLAQYLRDRSGLDTDWDLRGLSDLYEKIRVVNRHLSKRLNSFVATDSSVNAVISLDVFAAFLPMAIEESLEQLRPYFTRWLEPD